MHINAQVGRPAEQDELNKWYADHDLTPNKDGVFTSMPYEQGPVDRSVILAQVGENALRHEIPNVHPKEYNKRIFVYVAGGPTLADHLEEIKAKCLDDRYDVYTSNKTCKYLLLKGITPNYHLILDPTAKKIKDMEYEEKVPLVLGLQCHPSLFDKAIADGKPVTKFLAASITNEDGRSDKEVAKAACTPTDNMILGIGGGSMCGTRMIYMAAALGHRRIEYYGFDGCISYENNVVKCYAYPKPRGENVLETEASNGRKFFSTISLLRQGEELVSLMDILPGMDVEIYGDSLLSNQLAIYKNARKSADYRISPDYLAMQKKLHEGMRYGVAGSDSAPRVFMAAAQVHRKFGQCEVLDYGSGPGTLKKSIDSAFPAIPGVTIHEYDPAIAGKDAEPKPAEIVFCGDVLEHVEGECIKPVLDHIASLTKQLGMFIIGMVPAKKVLPDGRNAHISLHHKDWWLSLIRRHFIVVEEYSNETSLIVIGQKL